MESPAVDRRYPIEAARVVPRGLARKEAYLLVFLQMRRLEVVAVRLLSWDAQ